MNNKKIVGFVLSVVLLAISLSAGTQQQAKAPKIPWLGVRSDNLTSSVELFRRELRALGYVEGKNIAFKHRNADNKSRPPPCPVRRVGPSES